MKCFNDIMIRTAIVAFFIAAVLSVSHLIADTVEWTPDQGKTRKPENGDIISETLDEVEIKSGAATKKIKQKDVIQVTYTKQPSQMSDMERLFNQGEYVKAAEVCRKMLADPNTRSIFKQHLMYKIALCLQRANQLDEAMQEYDKLIKEIPTTKFLAEAFINKSRCALAKNDTKLAAEIADQAKDAIRKAGGDEKYIFELELFKAKIYINDKNDKKTLDARSAYSKVVQGALTKFPYLADRANVGLGQCDLLEKKIDEAERAFNTVIERAKDNIALLGAYNGRGDCYQEKAKKDKTQSRDLYKKALRDNYLRAKVMHASAEGESTSEYEKSIYSSAYCYEILSQYPPDDKKAIYTEHARAIYTELIKNFPNSSWRKEAEKRLAGLGSK